MIRSRQNNEVNSGSMADIAFLLLIFFLVSTTILNDQGILTKLPPYDSNTPPIEYNQSYVFNVLVNADEKVMVESNQIPIHEVGLKTKEFIRSNQEFGEVNKTIISLSCSRSASYRTYIDIYDQLKHAYADLWNEEARLQFGKPYQSLNKSDQKSIRNIIPLVISEAEI